MLRSGFQKFGQIIVSRSGAVIGQKTSDSVVTATGIIGTIGNHNANQLIVEEPFEQVRQNRIVAVATGSSPPAHLY